MWNSLSAIKPSSVRMKSINQLVLVKEAISDGSDGNDLDK
jgi:hypothetical protein